MVAQSGGADEKPIGFRLLSMPELPKTLYLFQRFEPRNEGAEDAFTYYFLKIATDQFGMVVWPSRHDLVGSLPDELVPLVEVKKIDGELTLTNPVHTLAVLKLLASKRLRFELLAQISAVGVAAEQPREAQVSSIEFLLTPTKVRLIASGAEIDPNGKFDKAKLETLLPGFQFEEAEDEGSTVWYVYSRRNAAGEGLGGIDIYLEYGNPTKIARIGGGPGAVDTAGATRGVPLTRVYRSQTAKCDSGLEYTCASEVSPRIYYSVDAETCGPGVGLPSYSSDKKLTKLDPCMKISSIYLEPLRR